MSLRARLDALTSAHNEASDPTGPALREAVVKLIYEEERVRPLKVGDQAPRLELRTYDDMSVASDDLLKSGPLVLTFYRGLWCPNCQKDLKSFAQLINDRSGLGALETHRSDCRSTRPPKDRRRSRPPKPILYLRDCRECWDPQPPAQRSAARLSVIHAQLTTRPRPSAYLSLNLRRSTSAQYDRPSLSP